MELRMWFLLNSRKDTTWFIYLVLLKDSYHRKKAVGIYAGTFDFDTFKNDTFKNDTF